MKYLRVFLVSLVLLLSSVSLTQALGPIVEFAEFQLIPTIGAWDWEHFTINGEHYLAVANYRNGPNSYNPDSKIYKWNGLNFVEYQTLPGEGSIEWKYFSIDGEHYLALASVTNSSGTNFNVNSKIYKWNGSSFSVYQFIATNGARNWEYFNIAGEHYLVVANSRDGITYNVDSKIYKWNGINFVEFQSIGTNGALWWEHFIIGSDHYLAVANWYNSSSWIINSKIYKWNGSNFAEFQSIPTTGAVKWEHFTIGSDHYLAVANYRNNSSFEVNSKIYKWNGSNFAEYQSIATIGINDWEYFSIDNEHYLALASYRNDVGTNNVDSKIYKWNGSSFAEFQTIATHGALDWKHFSIGNSEFLALAQHFDDTSLDIDSKIFVGLRNAAWLPIIVK